MDTDDIKKQFVIEIKNTGSKEVFVDTEIVDISIQGEKTTIHSADTADINPGGVKSVYIPTIKV